MSIWPMRTGRTAALRPLKGLLRLESLCGACRKRLFPKEEIKTPYHVNSHLQDHPNMNGTHWVDVSTDSWTRASPPYLVTVS